MQRRSGRCGGRRQGCGVVALRATPSDRVGRVIDRAHPIALLHFFDLELLVFQAKSVVVYWSSTRE